MTVACTQQTCTEIVPIDTTRKKNSVSYRYSNNNNNNNNNNSNNNNNNNNNKLLLLLLTIIIIIIIIIIAVAFAIQLLKKIFQSIFAALQAIVSHKYIKDNRFLAFKGYYFCEFKIINGLQSFFAVKRQGKKIHEENEVSLQKVNNKCR